MARLAPLRKTRTDRTLSVDAPEHDRRCHGSVNGNGGEGDQHQQSADEEEDDEGSFSRDKAKGFTLVFDVVRRFAQPLGIALPQWEGRVIETKKGVVRLLSITERAKQVFGEEGAQAVAAQLEQVTCDRMEPLQGVLFPLVDNEPRVRDRGRAHRPRAGFEVSDERLAGERTRQRSIVSTPRCCCRLVVAPTRCGHCSRTSRRAVQSFCGWPTPSPRSTRRRARRSDCSTPCCWQCRGKR